MCGAGLSAPEIFSRLVDARHRRMNVECWLGRKRHFGRLRPATKIFAADYHARKPYNPIVFECPCVACGGQMADFRMRLSSKALVMEVRRTSAAPQHLATPERAGLTQWQKALGVCLLLFYVAMIVITIITLPYAANEVAGGRLF